MFFPHSPDPNVHVVSDVSRSFGCGAILLHSQWLQVEWPSSWSNVDITVKELVPIVVAAAVWGRLWHRKQVQFHTNNMTVVDILRKRSARNTVAHHLLRCFYFYSAFFQFDYHVAHIPGVLNTAADALSRNNMTSFFSFVSQASRVHVPAPLSQLLITQ